VRQHTSIWTRGARSIQRIHGLPTPCYGCGQSWYPPEKFTSEGQPAKIEQVPLPLYEIKDSYGRVILCKLCIKANLQVLLLPEPVRDLISKPYIRLEDRKSNLPASVGEALAQMTKEEIKQLLRNMSKRGKVA
jgi:hypothetical protein